MHFLFISGAEIFVIFVIVLMLFGADKIPTIAKGLGKGMRQLKMLLTILNVKFKTLQKSKALILNLQMISKKK